MKNQLLLSTFFIALLTTFSGCAVVGDIFKAGMGVGIFIVIAVVALIVFLISKAGKNKS